MYAYWSLLYRMFQIHVHMLHAAESLWVEFFLAPFFFFFGARFFFFVGGWCRLELCHFCKLWQEKAGISAEFRVLQPNTPFGA